MPSEGRRLHGFTVVSRGLRLGRQFLFPAILGGASVADGIGPIVQWTLIILAVPSFGVAVAQWLAFRYRLEGDELIIDSGVLSRRRRVIPVARIQNVDLTRSPLERLAGVAELKLETASGGSDTEASLAVLELDVARQLQEELWASKSIHADGETGDGGGESSDGAWEARSAEGQARAGEGRQGSEAEREPERETLLQLSIGDLALAGATSNEAGLIAAGLATVLEIADDLVGANRIDQWITSLGIERWVESVFADGVLLGILATLLLGAGMALLFVVLGWLVSIVATVVRFYGFTLTRMGDDLRREYGLLSRNQSTIPLHRVQTVRIEETLLRRPLGLAALKIETAGFSPQQRQNANVSSAEAYVPITRRKDVGRLIRNVFEDATFEGVEMHPVAPVSRRRSFVRLATPIAVGTAVAAWFDPLGLLLGLLLVPAFLLANAQYRARAWGRPEGYAIVRGGVLTRVNAVIPERKIQTLHLWETPFQRRWDIATLMVDTAGGGSAARAVDLHRTTAESLMLSLARDTEDRIQPVR